ncbi:MAG: adenylyltransferase/cytidyltransferase family protein [Patescibacteria group bacterium]
MAQPKKGVYVGRFSPVHAGHEVVISHMIDVCGEANSLVVVGSCNHPISMRHFFSYKERRDLLRHLYPNLKVLGLPDYQSDEEWLLALDDILETCGIDPFHEATFFGGSRGDIEFFISASRQFEIINRYDGVASPKISASEVRDCLVEGRSIEGLVNPAIAQVVTDIFVPKWRDFRRQ